MYRLSNDDEFEPRSTPKPAQKLDYFAVPSVPEVSLIFDNPTKYTSPEHRRFDTPLSKKDDTRGFFNRSNRSPASHGSPANGRGSYAAWREQNLHWKTDNARVNESGGRTGRYEGEPLPRSYRSQAEDPSDSRRVIYQMQTSASPPQPVKAAPMVYNLGQNDHSGRIVEKQYPYVGVNPYQLPQFYADNQETVKNLLQLVNNQSEQIKALQSQVDRLLKLQEESFKERQRCSCSLQSSLESSRQSSSSPCDGNRNRKPASPRQSTGFVEQNVSIGVMTSFEFTVQNNPFPDEYKKTNPELQRQPNQENLGESLRRYKNSFTRIPTGHLENIVEDSESYLSSQQQSSNLNGSVSARDPTDKQIPLEQRELENSRRRVGSRESPVLAEPKRPVLENSEKRRLEEVVQRRSLEAEKERKALEDDERRKPVIEDRREELLKGSTRNCVEDSLVLSGGDLRLTERPPPTPEPSIHVDMQEYSSDEDSEKPRRSSKVGWTFYNNVLGQVNQILRNSSVMDKGEGSEPEANREQEQPEPDAGKPVDSVKVATLEQLKKLGISLTENTDSQTELNGGNGQKEFLGFDSSFYPRLDRQPNVTQPSTAVNETNTSMHMKALALKYLSDEQLGELALQRQSSVKHLMLSNLQGTNMSFATMRYLERYQLLPGPGPPTATSPAQQASPRPDLNCQSPKGKPGFQRFAFQTPRTTCPSKILDISTLKQQPKLL